MIDKSKIETILHANGVNPASDDDEIRSVLLSARYSKDEVNTAIMVLRENTQTHKTRVDGLHKIFRTNESLSPEEISQLLGIEVDASALSRTIEQPQETAQWQMVLVWVLSVAFGVGGVILFMYFGAIGPFHPAFQ